LKDTIDFTAYLNEYEFAEPCIIEHRESGMNNTTRIISSGNKKFVLRIYNNHKDSNIVGLEHEVLDALNKQDLTFQVPIPVHNKKGDTISVATDGTLSSLFHYIEGDRPTVSNPDHVYALGVAAAKLSSALSSINLKGKPLYSPYFMLENTYASMDEEAFFAMTDQSEDLASRKSSFLALHEERLKLIEECNQLEELPKQWIHGDLVFNNTVSQDDAIIGVLDFEFTTVDVRTMELAVITVDMIKPDDPNIRANVKRLLQGYQDTNPLTHHELKILPILMKLRLLDVALHFAVRLRDNLDKEEILCGIIDQTTFGFRWINEHWEDDF
jgi:homoserine kinase type II